MGATMVETRTRAARLAAGAAQSVKFYRELGEIFLGLSQRSLPEKDPRFADPAWQKNPLYKRVAQSYFAFCEAVDSVATSHPDWRRRERDKFLAGILTSAVAPTNTLLGNPAALRRAIETNGESLLQGARNFANDIVRKQSLPAQVKRGEFVVGENLALTPGAVVFRNEMLELLQYRPTTQKVRRIPTLMIVPPIGKYYFMDLAPKRSFTEFAVSRDTGFFTTSWRNPQPEQGHWGLDDYVQSCLEAVAAVCEITGSRKVNVLGLCAGGIIATLMLSYMARRKDRRVNAAAFGVMLLDFETDAPIGAFKSRPLLSLARRRAQGKGILPASSLSNVFAWMRPNDLIWNYWVNNYLHGKDPPAFDILGWSVDATNLPSCLHGQFLEIFERNLLVEKGALEILGEPVDLAAIKVDKLVTGAISDHLTPWAACYRTTQLLGGESIFVLSNSGHIASLVNPPGNPKSTYYLGPKPGPDPQEWLKQATKYTGTWWEVWAEWSAKRSGALVAAPKQLGSRKHPVLGPAPGDYVREPA
jgi:polyhydroxyalkanoate synthase